MVGEQAGDPLVVVRVGVAPRIVRPPGGGGQFAESVPAIDEAVEFLSRNQFGALIVIERTVPLSDMVRTGVPIDTLESTLPLRITFRASVTWATAFCALASVPETRTISSRVGHEVR